jgi:hypothetical protein
MRNICTLAWIEIKLYLREPLAAFFTLGLSTHDASLHGKYLGEPARFFLRRIGLCGHGRSRRSRP